MVLPNLDQYSAEFQDRLADEIEADTRSVCPRDILVPDCSAWLRAIADYSYLREKIEVAEGAS